MVLGPACIQRVHIYGKQQASTIVIKAHEGEEWYSLVYRSGDTVEGPTGAPEGFFHQVVVSKVTVHTDLKDQDDISNQTFNLLDQEHLMKVKLYCDKCTFKNVRVRKEHERYCSKNPNNKKVNCLFCGATFSNYSKLKGHMIKDHNVGK